MYTKKWVPIVLLLLNIKLSRQITNGTQYSAGKAYMVYLIRAKATESETPTSTIYDEWMCGGVIVTSKSIITSAACVEDVKFMFAVPGYVNYVPHEKLFTDDCAKNAKKKVIETCVPKGYNFAYDRIEMWSNIDIAVAKVEEPGFNLGHKPSPTCSYKLAKIRVNFNPVYQESGVDVFVLGWGHKIKWRQTTDTKDYNEKVLQWASTKIQPKEICKNLYKTSSSALPDIIENYMICAFDTGNIDANGEIIVQSNRDKEDCGDGNDNARLRSLKCIQNHLKSLQNNKNHDMDEMLEVNGTEFGQKGVSETNRTEVVNFTINGAVRSDATSLTNETGKNNNNKITRRHGICQNDHGGPLVTWVGAREYLVGVASVFRITTTSECAGPYLYTSTQCNGAFLDCVLKEDADWPQPKLRKSFNNSNDDEDNLPFQSEQEQKTFCSLPPSQRGFDLVRTRISWAHHPDGPANSEFDIAMDASTENSDSYEQVYLEYSRTADNASESTSVITVNETSDLKTIRSKTLSSSEQIHKITAG